MKDNIKYKDLSQGIKSEVEKFYNNEKEIIENLSIQDAMYQWFERHFDKWVGERYITGGNGNKRKFFRLDIEIPVEILKTLVESSKEESVAIELIGTIMNISRGGLYFKSDVPVEISSIITVKIDLSSVDKKLTDIEALTMVTRCDRIDPNKYGIGLMFSSIYDKHKENLDLFIFRNVAHHIQLFNQ